MKKWVVVLGLFFVSVPSFASELGYPKLFFSYSFLYDDICAGNNPVDDQWAAEASAREGEFAALWEAQAPVLMGALISEFGRGFTRKEMSVTLSVCPAAASLSNPLVLNVSRFMKSYMQQYPVRPDFAFVDLLFHELLHTWVVEGWPESSALLAKYKDESRSVRNHLHLMAVQKLIYLKLGRQDLLQWIGSNYSRMPGGYGRAWDIVNRIEGHEAFVAELRR